MDLNFPDANPVFTCLDSNDAPDSARIGDQLAGEIAKRFGPRDEIPLSVFARDPDGGLMGGLNGSTHWGWLYIRHFWVAEKCRARGLGREILAIAEDAARSRACVGVYLDTFNPESAAYYERCGFLRVGAIENFPPGHARVFLRKAL